MGQSTLKGGRGWLSEKDGVGLAGNCPAFIKVKGLRETQVPITSPSAFKMVFNTVGGWPHRLFSSPVLHVHFWKNNILAGGGGARL